MDQVHSREVTIAMSLSQGRYRNATVAISLSQGQGCKITIIVIEHFADSGIATVALRQKPSRIITSYGDDNDLLRQ